MEEELTGAVLYAECDRFLKLIPPLPPPSLVSGEAVSSSICLVLQETW